ncbi:hypothetical protein GSI_07524 [Ganoderma sinense ZZ0214-1]|uniref:Uncharacterized protein n=1 Tax=Ganoderma sinense ZZ0214-1 TaxID=1077348 RepID=A0A2G8S9A8_9APHY|nr:hypothetical protein GSI_07524 [Ganoderma sinense ZZ0214-1]
MIPMQVREQQLGPPVYRTPFADEWTKLEAMLIQVRNLLQKHRLDPVLVTLDKEHIRGPSSEGYEAWLTDRAAAQRRAFFARRKFLYHIAIISFHIAALWKRTNDPRHWYDYLLENGVQGHVLDSLSASVVADFTPNNPRAGLFIKPDAFSWSTYLPVLILANVPIFVYWGPVRSRIAAPAQLNSLKPSKEAVSAAQQLLTDVFDTEGRQPSFETTGRAPEFLSTDTPGTFFAERAAYRAARIRIETEEQRQRRLSREKRATSYLITSNGEDTVFEWDFDWERMRWKREIVLRHDRLSAWSGYDKKDKRYDSVVKEWDLAYFFESSVREARDGEELDEQEVNDHSSNPLFRDGDCKLDPPPPPNPPPPLNRDDVPVEEVPDIGGTPASAIQTPRPPTTTLVTPRVPTATLATPHVPTATPRVPIATTSWLPTAPTGWTSRAATTISGPPEDGEIGIDGEWRPNFPTLMAVLISRHLFRWGISLDDLPLPDGKLLSWSQACKAVGFCPTPEIKCTLDAGKSEGANAFATWVSCMVQNTHPPADWWLLASPSRLRELLRTNDLRIFHLEDPHEDRNLRMWCLDDRGHARYKRTWFAAVENPSTALATAMSHRSIDEAVRWMITTLIYSPRASYEVKQGLKMMDPHLGHRPLRRPTNYVFNVADFCAYEEFRDHFLQANPRIGRAALLAGGILWRLAIESVERDLVLDGPNTIKTALGITFALRDHADDVFIDDSLTADEIHIIIGTYTRDPIFWRNVSGSGFPSWWPDSGHFEASSLDFGWWSPVAEAWYCELRAKYRKGNAQPKTGPEWRNVLRNRDKRARMFTEHSKTAAAAFLRGIST